MMSSSEFSDLPNPFAFANDAHPSSKGSKHGSQRRQATVKALKYLIAVVLCLSGLLAARYAGVQWLLYSLTHDMDTLPPHEQQLRLVQIEGLGKPAIPHLVNALNAENSSTARTSFELLRDAQSQWPALGTQASLQHHAALLKALTSIAIQLPDERTGWANLLVQQALLESVDQSDEASQDVFQRANETLRLLALSDRSGPSILSDQPAQDTPQRLIVRSTPLPVNQIDEVDDWSRWPPERESQTSPPLERLPAPETITPSPSQATVLRSGGSKSTKLTQIEPNHEVVLRPITTETTNTPPVQPVAHLVDSPMKAYSARSVMLWLSSGSDRLRSQAEAELYSRGYDSESLQLATQMAHRNVQVRLAFVDQISRQANFDPRPWLWMMTEDEDRNVRIRVVSVLATMNDYSSRERLQELLVQEQDLNVASAIRKALGLR